MAQCRLVWLVKLLQTAETTLGETILPPSPHEPQRTLQTPRQRPQFPPPSRAKRTDTNRVRLGTLAHPPPHLPKPGRKPKGSGLRPWPPPAVKTATCPWSFTRPRGRTKFALFRTARAHPLPNYIRKYTQKGAKASNMQQPGQGETMARSGWGGRVAEDGGWRGNVRGGGF